MKIKRYKILLVGVILILIAGGFFVIQKSGQEAEAQGLLPLSPPTNVQKNYATTALIDWSWSAPVSGGLPIDYYKVYTGSGGFISDVTGTNYTQPGLNPSTQYSIKVMSCKYGSDPTCTGPYYASTFSSTAYGYTKANTPSNLTVSPSADCLADNYGASGECQLTWSWSANDNSAGTNYYYSTDEGAGAWTTSLSYTETISFDSCRTHTAGSTAHTFYVKAKNGEGEETDTTSLSKTEYNVCDWLEDFVLSHIPPYANQFRATWTPSPNIEIRAALNGGNFQTITNNGTFMAGPDGVWANARNWVDFQWHYVGEAWPPNIIITKEIKALLPQVASVSCSGATTNSLTVTAEGGGLGFPNLFTLLSGVKMSKAVVYGTDDDVGTYSSGYPTSIPLTWTVSNLSPNTSYSFKFISYNQEGTANWETEALTAGSCRTAAAVYPQCGTTTYSPAPPTWTHSSVLVSIPCTEEGGPGCSKSTYTLSRSSNGSGTIVISDIVGNTTECPYNVTNIDKIAPTVNSFTVDDHASDFTSSDTGPVIDWTVADSGGSGLKQVEVWRKTAGGDWILIYTTTDVSGNGPTSGSFTDSVDCLPSHQPYTYGIHVLDNANNIGYENNPIAVTLSNCGGTPTCGSNDNGEGDLLQATCENAPIFGKWNYASDDATGMCWKKDRDDPYLCCGDDSGENWDYFREFFGSFGSYSTDENDNACCNNASDCVFNHTCYDGDANGASFESASCMSGQRYCGGPNVYTWETDADYNFAVCQCLQGSADRWNESGWFGGNQINWSIGGYSQDRCCGDDAGEVFANGVCTTGAALPDLVVESVTPPTGLICMGRSATFSAVIKNTGNASTGAGFANQITLVDTGSCLANSTALTASESKNISCAITPSAAGIKTVMSQADYDDAISESNEDNNGRDTTATIFATPNTPTGLTATGIGATDITWDWDNMSGATSYIILLNGIPVDTVTSSQYIAQDLWGAADYTITVQSYNGCGVSSGAQHTVTRGVSLAGSPGAQTINQGASAIYTITVSSVNGLADTVNLTLSGCPSGATCQLSGSSVILNNNSQGVTLTVSNASVGGPYTLTISGHGVASNKNGATTVDLTVVEANYPSVSIWAIPQTIARGQSSVVSWTSNNASSVDITNIGTGLATSGNQSVAPTVTTTYTATAYGSGGRTATASVTVTVTNPTEIYCGDGVCNGAETCSTCPSDCGICVGGGGDSPSTPTNLSGPSGCTTDTTPSFSFTVSDPDFGDKVGYQIQIDDSATFASPLIDFTWSSLGDTPQNGTFDTPSSCPTPLGGYAVCNTPLPAGNYYWRVRALDNHSNFSSYESGSAFSVAAVCGGGGGVNADFTVCKYSADTFQFLNATEGVTVPTYGWNFDDGTGCAETGCTASIGGTTIGTRIDPAHKFNNNYWAKRIKITFSNGGQAENLVDFPVLIKLNGSRIDYTQTQNSGQDLRFFDADGGTELAYEIEKWNESGDSFVWVKVPQIDASSNSDYIWLYYGNPAATAGANAESVWNSGYAAVYHLKETSGKHYDSTANNNDSENNPNVQTQGSAAGKIDGADDFLKEVNGEGEETSSDSITINDSNSLDLTNALTIEAWVRSDYLENRDRIVSKGSISQTYVLRQEISDTGGSFPGSLHFFGAGVAQARSILTAGTLQYIAATWDGINGDHKPKLFNNGSEVSSYFAQTAKTAPINANTEVLTIGNIDQGWDGIIDEMRLSNVARSAAWLKAQYLSMSDTFNTFSSQESLGYVIDGGKVAGATDELRIMNQELRTTDNGQQTTDNLQQITNKNIFEKIWAGIKTAGKWAVNLFKAKDSEALSATYSVMLSVNDPAGNDTETKVVNLASVPLCEFNLTNVSSLSCGRVDGEWEKFGGFADAGAYTVKRCAGSGCSDFDTVSVTKSCSTSCYFEDIGVEPSTAYSYYISLPTQGVKNSTDNPACDGASAICPLSVTTAVCGVEGSDIVTTRACGKITLIWDEVEGSTIYEVQRAIGASDNTFTTVATLGAGTTLYEDEDVVTVSTTKPANQFRYWYRVRSQASNGQWSDWSAAAPVGGEYSYCYRGPSWEER
ncbi:MAG: DUF2341 domain-containing protein [Patescibacteria group bacterium]|nr:DUF2341 domain-containing protein [Patescibacteria group bacterium]